MAPTQPRISSADRCLKRWPMLPLLSIGLWSGWQFIAFSGTLPFSVDSGLIFSLAMFSVCLLAMLRPHLFRQLVRRPRFLVESGGVCSVGTFLLMMPLFAPQAATAGSMQVLSLTGQVLSGAGITCIALYSCELLGRLNPSNIWIWLAYSELLVVGLYFVVAGVGLVAGGVIFMALPLLAGFCLHLGDRPGSSLDLAQEERQPEPTSNGTFAKLAVFVLLLSLASSFARIISTGSNDGDFSLVGAAAARIFLAAAILVAIIVTRRQFPFSQLCMFISAMILIIFAYRAFGLPAGPVLFFLTTLAYGTLECVTIAMAACLSFKTTKDPIFISALFLIALYSGSGIATGVEQLGLITETSLSTVAFSITALASIIFAFYFIQDRTYNNLLGSIEDFELEYAAPETAPAPDARQEAAIEQLRTQFDLSPRECEVIEKLRGGSTVGRIAESMHLSVHTVRGYIHNIYAKCEVHSRNELLDLLETR